jgi:hypothetical protein
MATKPAKRPQQPARRPEKKFGPYHNGLGLAVWLNSVETEQGTRYFRSISIAPRRYRDPKDGQWKDAKFYRPVDLATLTLALEAARQYCASTPLPGQPLNEADEAGELHVLEDGEVVDNPTSP